MSEAQKLLNDDGSASIATAILMSHHAFRRDIALLEHALAALAADDAGKAEALREEWTFFRNALHGHHESEDTKLFPFLLSQHAELKAAIERLGAEHKLIDPLLVQGDGAMAALPDQKGDARRVVAEITVLLDTHLDYEEGEAIPYLRGMRDFPPPATAEEVQLIADGFAWSSFGVAEDVLAQVYELLPEALREKLPASRAKLKARAQRAWGTSQSGASRTCVPDWLSER